MINSGYDMPCNFSSTQGGATIRMGRVARVWKHGCTYHSNGLKKTYTTPEGTTYTYYDDGQDSPSAVGAGSAATAPPEITAANDEIFGYDGVGNRTTHTQATEEDEQEQTSATYNSLNQLISQTQNGVETTFTYNANGHTARKTTGGETTEYVYNHEERLIAVKKNGQKVGEYAYNPLGQRIKKTVNGQTTWYLYNDEGLAAEYNQQGQLIAEYHFTPYSTWMTEPLFQRKGGQVYYYQNDHLGTPQRMVNSTGEVVWEARYKAFGEAEIVTETVSNNLRFPGQYYDSETGLHHNYFRDYDPVTGRYVQADPIGSKGGVNFYVYVGNQPIRYVDPLGLLRRNGFSSPELAAYCALNEVNSPPKASGHYEFGGWIYYDPIRRTYGYTTPYTDRKPDSLDHENFPSTPWFGFSRPVGHYHNHPVDRSDWPADINVPGYDHGSGNPNWFLEPEWQHSNEDMNWGIPSYLSTPVVDNYLVSPNDPSLPGGPRSHIKSFGEKFTPDMCDKSC